MHASERRPGYYTVRFFATDNESTLPSSALQRYNRKQSKLRAGQGKVGSAALREQFCAAVALADEAAAEGPPLSEGGGVDGDWRFDGSPWIGRRVCRCFPGAIVSEATVVRWLPAGDAEEDVALWHVVHDDGDEEDLEEHELQLAAPDGHASTLLLQSAPPPLATPQPATPPPATPNNAAPAAVASTGVQAAEYAARIQRLHDAGGMRGALAEMKLESYAPALEESGWDDIAYLSGLSVEQLREVGASIGMRPGHVMKFASRLKSIVEAWTGCV